MDLFNSISHDIFFDCQQWATQAFEHYLKEHEIVHDAVNKYWISFHFIYLDDNLEYSRNKITTESFKKVKKGFSQDEDLFDLQCKLTQLFFYKLEHQYGIKCPKILDKLSIIFERPVINCLNLFNSNLDEKIYKLLEDKENVKKYISRPKQYLGFICLWLVLKEGIKNKSILERILSPNAPLYRIEDHLFYEDTGQRFWLSPMAEFLFLIKNKAKLSVSDAQ